MREGRFWAAVVSAERYAAERLYAFDTLVLPGPGPTEDAPRPGDRVALIAGGRLFGLGRVTGSQSGETRDEDVTVAYTHRLFDASVRVDEAPGPGLTALTAAEYQRLAGPVGSDPRTDADKTEWFVSVALPIEAPSPAEAVREFWTYVEKLGPRELPAFVWPRGDELAMQAYVLGAETSLDPDVDDLQDPRASASSRAEPQTQHEPRGA